MTTPSNDERASVYTHRSTALQEFFRAIAFFVAGTGWIWFGSMVWLKLSGAAIYATTRPEIVKVIDPQWDELMHQNHDGSGFTLKIGGNVSGDTGDGVQQP
jgi:hypothetical protein